MCRAPEAAENGLRLDALGNLISITVLSPAQRGRSAATRLDGGEHTRTLLASTAPTDHNILWSTVGEKPAHFCARQHSENRPPATHTALDADSAANRLRVAASPTDRSSVWRYHRLALVRVHILPPQPQGFAETKSEGEPYRDQCFEAMTAHGSEQRPCLFRRQRLDLPRASGVGPGGSAARHPPQSGSMNVTSMLLPIGASSSAA